MGTVVNPDRVGYIKRMARPTMNARLTCPGLVAAALCSLIACAAGGGNSGESPAGTAGAGVVFNTGDGLDSSGDLLGNEDGLGGGTRGCNELDIAFEPQTPTALIIVDRSSSQWDGYPNHTWDPVSVGLLEVVQRMQDSMRVGVVTYTGENGGACPDLVPAIGDVTFGQNNFDTIRQAIESVDEPPYKGETPTAAAINQALPALLADPSPGEKFILLVTDGDPDFCNDPDRICPMDAVVGAVQDAYVQGVSTTVFGLRRAGVDLSERHLGDVANAGAGQPVALPQEVNGNLENLENRCGTVPLGTYAAAGGQAQYFQANGVDQLELESALAAIVLGIRSCVFDLDGSVEVNVDLADLATIQIDDDPPLTFGDPNGWRMISETQLELVGGACQRLKSPETRGVGFDFPCDLLVPR